MLFGSLSQLKIYSRNSSSPVEQTDDLHYRLRVVDLIESLAKSRSANPHLVLVLLPLFSIVRGSATVEQESTSSATIVKKKSGLTLGGVLAGFGFGATRRDEGSEEEKAGKDQCVTFWLTSRAG